MLSFKLWKQNVVEGYAVRQFLEDTLQTSFIASEEEQSSSESTLTSTPTSSSDIW